MRHLFTNPVADGTNTQIVRPSDWNAVHIQELTLSGNTAGQSTVSGTNVVFQGGDNLTLSAITAASLATIVFSAAPQSVDTSRAGTGFTSTTQGGTAIGGTLGSNGISLAVPPFLTTGAQSNHSHNLATTTTNGVSIVVGTANSAGATLGVPSFLTTAAQSGHSHGDPTLALTNLSGTTASNSAGFTLSLSAAAGGGGADGYNILAAGTQTAGTANTISFANSNNISFGMSGSSQITASVYAPALTAVSGNTSGGQSTFAGRDIVLQGGSRITVSVITGPSGDTLSVNAAAPNHSITAGTDSGTVSAFSRWMLSNANGISWGFSSSAGNSVTITASHNAAASDHSHGNPTLALTNLSGTTASASNGLTISLSAAAGGGGADGYNILAAGTQTAGTANTVNFANSNGITFGMSGSSQVTASHNGLTTAAQSDHSHGVTLNLTNISGTTGGDSAGIQLSLSAAAPGGGGNTVSTFIPYYPGSTGAQTFGATGTSTASAFFWPVSCDNNVVFNQIRLLLTASWVTSTAAGSQTITSNFGIYSRNGDTLSAISTGSFSMAMSCSGVSGTLSYPSSYGTAAGYGYGTTTASTTAQGQSLWGTAGNKVATLGFANSMSLAPGLYWLAAHARQSSSSNNVGLVPAMAGNVMAAAQNAGPFGAASTAYSSGSNAVALKFGWGVATSTGSASYGGTKVPDAYPLSALGQSVTQMPMVTFISV